MTEYLVHITIICLFYSVISMGQLVVMGWGGVFNLAQISLAAVGAYTLALLTTDYAYNFWLIFFLSPFVSVIASVPLVLISQRLKTDYFAVGSLAFALIIQSVLINWRSVTHGVLGVTGIPRPELFGKTFDDNLSFLFLMFAVWIACFGIVALLRRSTFKLFLVAQSEFEESVSSLGINPGRCRMAAFVIGSFFAGIGGALCATYISFIDPSSFSLSEMIFILSILVLSGMRSQRGLFGATVFLVAVPELLRFTDMPSSILGPLRQFMYALILFSVIYARRSKIFPTVRSL